MTHIYHKMINIYIYIEYTIVVCILILSIICNQSLIVVINRYYYPRIIIHIVFYYIQVGYKYLYILYII